MVKVRGRNSNGKTVKQTVKNGQKISGDDAARPAWVMVPGVSSSRLRPDSDQSRIWCRARPWLVCDSLNELTWVSFARIVEHWHLTNFFFFFFWRFVSVVWQEQWQSTECDTRYVVQRKKFDVILRFLVDRYRRTKPPKPDASQFVVPARLPKPATGSGGLSSSRFDDDVPEVNCTWTASFSWRVKEAALWFESYGSKNLTGGTTWSSLNHSPPQPIDWREHTIGAVHDRNLTTRSLQVPESYENFLWHRVKVRRIVTGLCLTASRWWARWRSESSSCQHHVITWRGLIPAVHEYLDSVAWPCHDCEVAPVWHHDVTNACTCQFSAVCLTVFPFEFRPRNFTIGFYGKNSIISEIMILECSFPLTTASMPLSRKEPRALKTQNSDIMFAKHMRNRSSRGYNLSAKLVSVDIHVTNCCGFYHQLHEPNVMCANLNNKVLEYMRPLLSTMGAHTS